MLPDVEERFGRDRKWFDMRRAGGHGIEAKTFQVGAAGVAVGPGSSVQNVLKRASTERVIPDAVRRDDLLLPQYLTADQAGAHLHRFFLDAVAADAAQKRVDGDQHMVTMFRNADLTSIGLWSEPVADFLGGLFRGVAWDWVENTRGRKVTRTLVATSAARAVLRWYWDRAEHVNVTYTAPAGTFVRAIVPAATTPVTLTPEELERRLQEAYDRGFAAGAGSRGRP